MPVDLSTHQHACPQCGYNLRGLPDDHTCPECGFVYQFAAIETLTRQLQSAHLALYASIALLTLPICALLLGGALLRSGWFSIGLLLPLMAILFVIVFIGALIAFTLLEPAQATIWKIPFLLFALAVVVPPSAHYACAAILAWLALHLWRHRKVFTDTDTDFHLATPAAVYHWRAAAWLVLIVGAILLTL